MVPHPHKRPPVHTPAVRVARAPEHIRLPSPGDGEGRRGDGRDQPLRGLGKAVGLASSRRAGLPAVGWVGMERAAGTDGTDGTAGMPVLTLTVRVPAGSGVPTVSAVVWAAALRAP